MEIEKLKKLIKKVSKKPALLPEITPQSRYIEDLMLDSLTIVSLVVLVEEEFEIDFEDFDGEMDALKTVGGTLDVISRLSNTEKV